MQNLKFWQEYKQNKFQVGKEVRKLTSRDVITKLPLHRVTSEEHLAKRFFFLKWEFFIERE